MKGGLAILLSGPKKGLKSESAEEPDEDDSPSSEQIAAFKELAAALKSGDAKTGAMALKNFMHECGDD